jgi:hypothetical protein
VILAEILVTKPVKVFAQVRLGQKFLTQIAHCHVGGGELVGDWNATCGAKQVQLEPVDAEGAPPFTCDSAESRRLGYCLGCNTERKERLRPAFPERPPSRGQFPTGSPGSAAASSADSGTRKGEVPSPPETDEKRISLHPTRGVLRLHIPKLWVLEERKRDDL